MVNMYYLEVTVEGIPEEDLFGEELEEEFTEYIPEIEDDDDLLPSEPPEIEE